MTPVLPARHQRAREVRLAIVDSMGLAIACLISYWFATSLLTHLLWVSAADDLLGGMWAVIATVFVYRTSVEASISAALSRVAATFVSFVLCQLYLLAFPFSAWGMVTLIGVGSVILTLLNHPSDIVTAGATTAVVMVVAGLSPEEAQLQPMLRLLDTVLGVGGGVVAAALRGASLRAINDIPAQTGEQPMKILMVLTSHDQLGNTGRKTGFWLEEFAAPYFVFTDAGVELTLASPKGGQPPIDPKSDLPENQTAAMTRFKQDKTAQRALAETAKLSEVNSEHFDTIFYVGGHGPMWDLVDNPDSIALVESFYNSGKPVAAVCHSPAVLHRVMYKGAPLVKGKHVTGFTNGEEEAVHLTHVVPFLVEDELKRIGGLYEKADDWESFAIVDGRVVTGQNPASSTAVAEALLKLLTVSKAA